MKYVFQHIFRIDPVQRKGRGREIKAFFSCFPNRVNEILLALWRLARKFQRFLFHPFSTPGFRQIIAECERNKLGVSGESVNDRIGSLICIKIFVILFLTWISIGNNSFFLSFSSSSSSSIFLINAMEIGRA